MTFSLIARCAKTGNLGMVVATYTPAAARAICVCSPGRGIAVVQALGSAEMLTRAGKMLDVDANADWIVKALALSDNNPELRQLAAVDAKGRAAARTGERNPSWAGHVIGDGFVAAGNVLVGERVVTNMAKAYEASASDPLGDRLMRAIEAGRDAGGQPEGQTSAAIRVFDTSPYAAIDLRIDAALEPVGELRRLYDWFKPLPAYYATQTKSPTGQRWWQYMNEIGHGSWADWLKRTKV
jgi:uncharacterized Ntn-hydrolase superfamily protein